MRQIRVLVERGWSIEINMGMDGWYYVGACHSSWGDVRGASDNFSEAIKKMFDKAKELEKQWR